MPSTSHPPALPASRSRFGDTPNLAGTPIVAESPALTAAGPGVGSRWMLGALALWFALGLACSIRTVVWPEKRTVFPVFSAGARHWWADESLYYPYPDNTGGFRYSPLFAIFMTPFAALGNTAGGIAWVWLSLGVYLLGLRRFVRDVLPGDWPPWREALFLTLACWGGVRCAWNAQANMLVVGCLLLAAAALVRERWWQAALLLAAPVFLKLSPLAVALLFCALAPVRLTPRFAVVLLVGAALPLLTRPPGIVLAHYYEWFAHLTGSSEARWPGLRDGWTVCLLLRSYLGEALDLRNTPVSGGGYRLVQFGAAAALLGWCLWQSLRGTAWRSQVLATLGGGIAWLMIFGPATEFPTYVILAPLTAFAIVEAVQSRRALVLALLAWAFTAVLPWHSMAGQFQDDFTLIFAMLPVGAACFAAWLVVYAECAHATAVRPLPALPSGTIIEEDIPRPVAA